MAHEIVQGVDVCLTRTKEAPAWHSLDRRFECIDAPTLRAEGFAREVTSEPVWLGDSVEDSVDAEGYRGIVTTDLSGARRGVSVVSTKYKAPADGYGSLVRLIEPLLEKGLLKVVSAGTLRGYSRAYLTCELGEGLLASVVGRDIIRRYWTLTDALDGKHARTSFACDTRVVCANTLAIANHEAQGRQRIRHSAGFELRSEAWRDMILAQQAQLDEQAEAFRALAAKQVDAAALDSYLRECFEMSPASEEEGALPKKYSFAIETHDADTARGTLWGAYNAAQSTLQWFSRGGRTSQARMDDLFFGTAMASNQAYLNNALALL